MYVSVCVGLCVCVWYGGWRTTSGVSCPQKSHPPHLRQGLSLAWRSPIRPAWRLVSYLQASNTAIISMHHHLSICTWVLGIKLRSSSPLLTEPSLVALVCVPRTREMAEKIPMSTYIALAYLKTKHLAFRVNSCSFSNYFYLYTHCRLMNRSSI